MVFAYHLRPGAFERLVPPGDGTQVVERSGAIDRNDMRVELSVPVLGPIRQRWTIRHEGYEAGRRFFDVMERGPFSHWRHEHLVEPIDDTTSELIDRIEYALPGGAPGARIGVPITEARLRPMFDHRHAITTADVQAIAASPLSRQTVRVEAVAASTTATQLAAFLLLAGHDVISTSIEILGVDLLPRANEAAAMIRVGAGTSHTITITVPGRRPVAVDGADSVTAPRRVLGALVELVGLTIA